MTITETVSTEANIFKKESHFPEQTSWFGRNVKQILMGTSCTSLVLGIAALAMSILFPPAAVAGAVIACSMFATSIAQSIKLNSIVGSKRDNESQPSQLLPKIASNEHEEALLNEECDDFVKPPRDLTKEKKIRAEQLKKWNKCYGKSNFTTRREKIRAEIKKLRAQLIYNNPETNGWF